MRRHVEERVRIERRADVDPLPRSLVAGKQRERDAAVLDDLPAQVLIDRFLEVEFQHQIERGPGRHGVSNAFYLYLRDPDGHRVRVFRPTQG